MNLRTSTEGKKKRWKGYLKRRNPKIGGFGAAAEGRSMVPVTRRSCRDKRKRLYMRRKKLEEKQERLNQMKLLGKNKSRPKL